MKSHTNPDRVTPPVVQLGLAGVILAAVARALIDRYIDPADRELWWNIFQSVVVPGIALAFAWVGAQRARQRVTPVLPGDQPRDLQGRDLAPVDHGPAGGYPPTRAATEEERERRLPRRRKPPTTNYP